MYGYTAERHVPGDPAAVRAAIADLVRRQWGDHSRVVVDSADREQVYAIATVADGDADVWLTWKLEPAHRGTLVRLRLDELDAGPDPTDALHELLARLSEASARAQD